MTPVKQKITFDDSECELVEMDGPKKQETEINDLVTNNFPTTVENSKPTTTLSPMFVSLTEVVKNSDSQEDNPNSLSNTACSRIFNCFTACIHSKRK